jgi:hypothetical protein
MTLAAFDQPFDPLQSASITYSIRHSITYSIGFDRPFDHLCSIPPHPYADRSARFGPDGPRSLRPQPGRQADD